MFLFLLLALSAAGGWAQTDPDLAPDCNNITPRGANKSDTKAIRNCLCTQRKAILTAGQFLLNGPIVFPRRAKNPDPANCSFADVTGTMLAGQGAGTVLNLKADCSSPWPSSGSPLTFEPVIDIAVARGAILKNLTLKLDNLRQSCNLAVHGGFAVRIGRDSFGSTVSGLRIQGNKATTGGANSGGINVFNSAGTEVKDNVITTLGYTLDQGTTSNGGSAIRFDNSGCEARCSNIEHNTISEVAFGIEVSNQIVGGTSGYEGDSSGTQIVNNDITGASFVTSCGTVGCAQGRAIKVQAFGTVPVTNLLVQDNKARNFGGRQEGGRLIVNGSGLDLIGVQGSRFIHNTIDSFGDGGIGGASSGAEFGLQLRPFPGGVTQGNTFNLNFFRSGQPAAPCATSCTSGKCTSGCADVNFNGVPDQTGLARTSKGTNNFRNYRP
jgi:hypothetical protein